MWKKNIYCTYKHAYRKQEGAISKYITGMNSKRQWYIIIAVIWVPWKKKNQVIYLFYYDPERYEDQVTS